MPKKLLIFIPTYNEVENVRIILEQLVSLNLNADIFFVDDNSPDGTGVLLNQLAFQYPGVIVEHRPIKAGIGSAHRYGINWAYDHGYQSLLTMDCDLTHSPEYISLFLSQADSSDLIVGSRFLDKKSLSDWNLGRYFLTHLGHFVTRLFLGMPYDSTGAFRFYKLNRIPQQFLYSVKSNSYSFFFESLFVLHRNKLKITEISTVLPARTYGHSKMQLKDTIASIRQLLRLLFRRLFQPHSLSFDKAKPSPEISQNSAITPIQDWNTYWGLSDRNKTHPLYNMIAAFYRQFIISPNLNRFALKYFSKTDIVLHAGCGSGQVDTTLTQMRSIIALDLSPKALYLYKTNNHGVKELIQASIFAIPIKSETLDGIYNLGVMEHFTIDEVQNALNEFYRVLKPGGQILLFWPHRMGLSVMALKVIHVALNSFSKKTIQLHPPEITYIQSKSHANQLLEKGGFSLCHYSFNISDAFTQAVVIGKKI